MTNTHLGSGDVVAYLERTLPSADRERLESHLVGCAECRREIIEVSRIRRAARRRAGWWILAPTAAAAAVLAVVLIRPGAPVFRDGGDEPAGIVLVSPRDGAVVTATPVTFTWRSAGIGVSYRVMVTDTNGDSVWSFTGSDTTAGATAGLQLQRGAQYYWYVDGLLPDGRSITSGLHPFTVRQ